MWSLYFEIQGSLASAKASKNYLKALSIGSTAVRKAWRQKLLKGTEDGGTMATDADSSDVNKYLLKYRRIELIKLRYAEFYSVYWCQWMWLSNLTMEKFFIELG